MSKLVSYDQFAENRMGVITQFYGLQSEGKFIQSYEDCLTEGFQKRWKSKEEFNRGYGLVKSIYDLEQTSIAHGPTSSHIEVSYKTTELVLSHDLTDAIQKSNQTGKRETERKKKEFFNLLIDLGGDKKEVKKTRNRHFYHDNGVNAMVWLFGLSYTPDVLKHFKVNEKITNPILFGIVEDTPKGPKIGGLKQSRADLPLVVA